MIDTATLLMMFPLFFLAAISPGPDIILILSQGLRSRRNGLWTVLGIYTGCNLIALAVAFGLGNIFDLVPVTYTIMKVAGAGYLLYLAYKIIRSQPASPEVIMVAKPQSATSLYLQALATNLLNPKAILFFSVVIPQFADPARGALVPQMVMIGLLGVFFSFLGHMTFAMCCSQIAKFMKSPHPRMRKIQNGLLAGVLSYFAFKLVTSHRP